MDICKRCIAYVLYPSLPSSLGIIVRLYRKSGLSFRSLIINATTVCVCEFKWTVGCCSGVGSRYLSTGRICFTHARLLFGRVCTRSHGLYSYCGLQKRERERAEVCCLCNDSPGLGALAFAARKTALPLYQINVTWTKTLRKA